MSEVTLFTILEGLWGLIAGSIVPLFLIYTIRSVKRAQYEGFRRVIDVTWRITKAIAIFIAGGAFWFLMLGFLVSVEGFEETMAESLTGAYTFVIGLLGGLWLIVSGFRKGRKAARESAAA